ncbi:unnamed protein product [Coffea canephora]|uniref:DH200=94 genomic scaffold, scaffold_343 n=1 Tax=Coffea canephora TaxID=49390 RepID=A0A068VEB7_COFCA|nr:unnamed protein product [Coffea canephora]
MPQKDQTAIFTAGRSKREGTEVNQRTEHIEVLEHGSQVSILTPLGF